MHHHYFSNKKMARMSSIMHMDAFSSCNSRTTTVNYFLPLVAGSTNVTRLICYVGVCAFDFLLNFTGILLHIFSYISIIIPTYIFV